MKEWLLKMIKAKEEARSAVKAKGKASTSIEEVRSLGEQSEALDKEIMEFRSQLDAILTEVPPAVPAATPLVVDTPPEQRQTQIPQGQFNPLGTYGVGAALTQAPHARSVDFENMSREDLLGAPEYRSAYLKNMQNKKLNEVEQRALTTAAGSGGAAVPTTTYDKIIEKLRQTSVLFPLIGATYLPGNVILPVANARTAALWTSEAADAAFGDDTVAGVVLAGYTLAKYAKVSIAAMVMTIDAFENYIVKQITEQLAIAVENAILNGVGATQPTGILPGVTWDSTNSLTYAASGLVYDDFVGIRALLKTVYRMGAMWVFNANMEAAMMKIKTSTGKPIFTQDPANGFIQKILNMPYAVDDYMPDNTILLGRLDYYFMNFSQPPVIEASRDAGFSFASVLYRGLLIADGKPALSEAFCKLTMGS